MKIAAALEYCGSRFNGWQRLKEDPSVQQCVEEALSCVADQAVQVQCAGRTDSGVHARYQVIHFETIARRDVHSWVFGANANLPADVSVLWARPVPEEFHARYSAVARSYDYIILNRPVRSGLYQHLLTWEYRPLDTGPMVEAAAHLLGQHDFTSFRAQGCQAKSPVRQVHELQVERSGDYIIISIRANAFLYHMVRNIVGSLTAVGAGKESPDWVRQVLEARNRTLAGVTAPPHGLYLTNIEYPEKFAIPPAEKVDFGPLLRDFSRGPRQ